MSFIENIKHKYVTYIQNAMNDFIDDAHLNDSEIRLLQRFITDYLLNDHRNGESKWDFGTKNYWCKNEIQNI